jgi:hypothetical protein
VDVDVAGAENWSSDSGVPVSRPPEYPIEPDTRAIDNEPRLPNVVLTCSRRLTDADWPRDGEMLSLSFRMIRCAKDWRIFVGHHGFRDRRRWSLLHGPPTELLTKHPVLLAKVIDALQLVLIHPPGDGDQHELEWIQTLGSFAHYRETWGLR